MGYLKAFIDKAEIIDELRDTKENLLVDAIEMVDDVADIFLTYFLLYTRIGETHQLYDQTIIEDTATLGRAVFSLAPEFIFVVEPTQAHRICPVNKQSLYWPELGHPLPIGRCVEHPGTPADDYPMLAYMDGIGDAENRADSYLDKIVA